MGREAVACTDENCSVSWCCFYLSVALQTDGREAKLVCAVPICFSRLITCSVGFAIFQRRSERREARKASVYGSQIRVVMRAGKANLKPALAFSPELCFAFLPKNITGTCCHRPLCSMLSKCLCYVFRFLHKTCLLLLLIAKRASANKRNTWYACSMCRPR